MKITVLFNGQNFGPFEMEEIADHVRRGNLSGSELAQREGRAEWRPLKEMLNEMGQSLPVRRADVPVPVEVPSEAVDAPPAPDQATGYAWWVIGTIVVCLVTVTALYHFFANPPTPDFPVGTWTPTDAAQAILFTGDGAFRIKAKFGVIGAGTWTLKDKMLTLKMNGSPFSTAIRVISVSPSQAEVEIPMRMPTANPVKPLIFAYRRLTWIRLPDGAFDQP